MDLLGYMLVHGVYVGMSRYFGLKDQLTSTSHQETLWGKICSSGNEYFKFGHRSKSFPFVFCFRATM